MGAFRLCRWALAASLSVALTLVAGTVQAAGQDDRVWQAIAYSDPEGRFQVLLPKDGEIVDPSASSGDGLRIRSVHGYSLTIQALATDPVISLANRLGRFEAEHVGADGTWTHKLDQETLSAGGLPALEATYEGPRSRARLVIASGEQFDFALFFHAPRSVFRAHEAKFDAVLASFRPMGASRPQEPPHATTGNPAGTNAASFHAPALGIALDVPPDWRLVRDEPTVITLTGPGAQGRAQISVQTLAVTPGREGSLQVEEALAQIRDVHHAEPGTAVIAEASLPAGVTGFAGEGAQIMAHFTEAAETRQRWVVVVPPAGPTATLHVFTFAAPRERFDTLLPLAAAVLQTLRPAAMGAAPRPATSR